MRSSCGRTGLLPPGHPRRHVDVVGREKLVRRGGGELSGRAGRKLHVIGFERDRAGLLEEGQELPVRRPNRRGAGADTGQLVGLATVYRQDPNVVLVAGALDVGDILPVRRPGWLIDRAVSCRQLSRLPSREIDGPEIGARAGDTGLAAHLDCDQVAVGRESRPLLGAVEPGRRRQYVCRNRELFDIPDVHRVRVALFAGTELSTATVAGKGDLISSRRPGWVHCPVGVGHPIVGARLAVWAVLCQLLDNLARAIGDNEIRIGQIAELDVGETLGIWRPAWRCRLPVFGDLVRRSVPAIDVAAGYVEDFARWLQ